MERWVNKVAVVSGASSGIGAAIAIDLLNAGVKVVGLARRKELTENLKSKVKSSVQKNLFALKCDVGSETDVKNAFQWIDTHLGGVDILVNNAGCIRITNIVDKDNTQMLKDVVDANIWGTVYCVREAFHSMKKRDVAGHVILMNSVLGHGVPYFVGTLSSFNIYPPAKHAVTAMTEVLRQEFQALGTKIKITVNYIILLHFVSLGNNLN